VPDLISLDDAADEFGVNRVTIFRYLRSGRLRRYKRAMDRKTYVDRQQIARLLKLRVVSGGTRNGKNQKSR
jgi:predicted site-specific integrase-resolvase